jgi:hypothetical protein
MKQRTIMFALLAVFALALAAPLAASAQAHPAVGTIASRSGSSFTLNNGEVVFMHPGTVINPTGTDLQPGQTVTVYGHYSGDGTINADTINLGAPANYYNGPVYGPPNYERGWYDMNGNWHPYQRGWYDQYGNWHQGY